ncbi:YqfO family protein [Thiomicrorhabdus sp.]|uniref:YqfO family protein n=1 Tax=Thiomicrorhabdus sp. TaxID=2039724 RepID=UPI0029C948F4|nr:YqfO family protein [Thiomicrorhabdus sp.]
MLKLCVYIPHSHLEEVKQALFAAGAGRIGNYDCCCWQVLGEGQFRPLEGSEPFIGHRDEVEKVREYRVEMVFQRQYLSEVLQALRASHPYETPAYDVMQLMDLSEDKVD